VANLAAWYQIPAASSADDFEQGDIFTNATIPNISAVDLSKTQEIPTRRGSFIVLTQSCDVPKAETILLAEVYLYSTLLAGSQSSIFKKSETKDRLIRNRFEHYFLVPPYGDDPKSWSLVSFRNLHVVSRAVLQDLARDAPPIGMASPYKEFLGESFARFMMRIAVPEPLDEFKQVRFD
jgi:hypothetical protein